MDEPTRGEMLVKGLEQIREGLNIVSGIGRPNDLLKMVVGSPQAAKRLREVLDDNSVLQSIVISLVQARNSRLSGDTVKKIIGDFLDVLFDLSKPAKPPIPTGAPGLAEPAQAPR